MGGWIFGLVFLVLGVIFLIVGIVSMRRSKAAKAWPLASGTVLHSELVRHENTDSDGSTSVSYEPVVEYEYSVIGQPFNGRRIAFGANQFNYKKAAEIAGRYPAGARVTVHYNPDKPKDAVLEATAQGGVLFTVIGGVASAGGLVAVAISLF